MLVRELKLRLTKSQEAELNRWLPSLQSVYNFGLRKIELNAQDKIYFSRFDFQSLLKGHSKTLGIPSHCLQGVLLQAYRAWERCFKKTSGKPRLKSQRRPLRSIPFPDPIKPPKDSRVGIPGLGKVRYFKQDLPEGKIKCGRVVQRASGWYLQLTIDAQHTFPVKECAPPVGIDTGFKALATLSDGTTYVNPRELRLGALRLAQAQRGRNKKLAARLQERQANRRKDRNHKISREIVENYSAIYVTNDNLRGQAKRFGKSIAEAGISQLRQMLLYKGAVIGSRAVALVDSKNTTRTCSACGCLSGPTGLSGLSVRQWECTDCGGLHDRDVNAARNILFAGLGWSHESGSDTASRNPRAAPREHQMPISTDYRWHSL